jgi:hypothetical protein
VQVHGGGAKGEHARVEHERPVAVPGAEEGIDHGGASAWKRRKGGHAQVEHKRPVVVLDAEEGIDHGGIGHDV